jgi:hypothetical protein
MYDLFELRAGSRRENPQNEPPERIDPPEVEERFSRGVILSFDRTDLVARVSRFCSSLSL